MEDMNTSQQSHGGLDVMIADPGKRELIGNEKGKVIRLLDTFLNRYVSVDLKFKNLDEVFRRLKRSRKEFDATRFFVLVVGPVKSGKSTLVNIFARKYVSPTAFRECTALPTLIGKAVGAHQNRIVQFFPKLDKIDPSLSAEARLQAEDELKVQTFNSIIDVLRGVESADILNNLVTMNTYELNEQTIDEIVGLNPDAVSDNRELLVSIGVDGKGFIDDEIVLIDMPGLDGRQVNADNMAVYKAMADRADFIFFVQSTTTAINNATNGFLTDLFKDKVKRVPIRLIHNVHDSQYFKPEEETRRSIAEQVQIGRECIQKTFGIKDFDDLSINLGMVNCGLLEPEKIKEEYRGMIEEKLTEYKELEQKLINTLKNERQVIKDRNCIGGAIDVLHYAETVIWEDLATIDVQERKIQHALQVLDSLPGRLNGLMITDAVFLSRFDDLVRQQDIISNWETIIEGIVENYLPNGGDSVKGSELKATLDQIAGECSGAVPTREGTQFREQLKDTLCECLLGEPLKGVIEAVEQEIKNTNDDSFHFELAVESDLLTAKPRSFSVKYFDIQERRKIPLWAKTYSHTQQGNYINAFKNVMKNDLSKKIGDYRLTLKADFVTIRDRLINQLKEQLQQYTAHYEETQQAVLAELNRQKTLLHQMLNDLNFHEDEHL